MAITDILNRIETDATAEAAAIVSAAEAEAARILANARATVASERTAALEAAQGRGNTEAATLLANARLEARDALLTQKRAMAEAVLVRAKETLESLSDSEYLQFIVTRVTRASSGGETLSIAAADTKRLSGLGARLAELDAQVTIASDPAPISKGVLLSGDRVHTEVSPEALVADHRDELLLAAARELFGEKG